MGDRVRAACTGYGNPTPPNRPSISGQVLAVVVFTVEAIPKSSRPIGTLAHHNKTHRKRVSFAVFAVLSSV